MNALKSPFPYFGGKRIVAPLIWQRFGRVANYVEPFFGSGAVLLANPAPHTETVNDIDGLLCNFWRALQADPDAVAHHADWPVSELDLHARHRWLVNQRANVTALLDDPAYSDAKIAGWWVWGISQWIGRGWCPTDRPAQQIPHLGDRGRGVHRRSLWQQRPHLGSRGVGVHRSSLAQQIPDLRDRGSLSTSDLVASFRQLAARLRRVRVCCGEWERVLGSSVTVGHGPTAILLDPPYAPRDRAEVYTFDSSTVFHDVCAWARANGDTPLLRIAVCGYDEPDLFDDTWSCVRWQTGGGYASRTSRGQANRSRECIWFSPHCCVQTQQKVMELQ